MRLNARGGIFVLLCSRRNCSFPQVYMWVGSQTSQVEIKLSLKACQVSAYLSPSRVVQVYTRVFMPRPLLCRFTSSTCALKMQNTPGNCGWCERETSPTASRDASTPGALSKPPPLKPTRTPKDAHLSAAILFFSNTTASPPC